MNAKSRIRLKAHRKVVAAEVTRLKYLCFPTRHGKEVRASSRRLLLFKLALCFGLRLTIAAESPLTPGEALSSFRLEPGLRIELVAAEPTVVSPVALAFDEAGRMYVAENRGYPTGPGESKPPAGVIALLEDSDGDGRFEKRTIFADGLTFPNGVMPWRGGILVTCAPDVWFLKDTDGDGRADIRRVVLTGFDAKNTTQLRVSHPTLGIDNWVYLTSGLTGGKITSPDHPDHPPIDLKTDARFRPDTGEFEVADGKAQFGLCFDDFGRRFVCMNRVQVQHVVLPSRYLRRNPYLAFSESVQNCPEAKNLVASALRTPNAATRIYPISRNITTADSHAGTFTAACGVLIYRGTGLPEEYRGNAFSCDPTGNLVHCDKLVPAGATFDAGRTRESIEFLASTDDWFRPVFLANGPDGALYICDMYRKTIEHPQYLPEEIRKRTDFDSGKDRGRIYRVIDSKRQTTAGRPKSDLNKASVQELCVQLNNPNAWWRETAQRLLVERQDQAAVPYLRTIISILNPQPSTSPAAAAHALRSLEGLGALDEASILAGLNARHPGVREQAIQLAEPRLKDAPELLSRVLTMAEDPDARVRFQCALALGEVSDARAIPALSGIARRDVSDRWARAAVLSSLRSKTNEPGIDVFMGEMCRRPLLTSEAMLVFLEEVGRLRGASPATGLFYGLVPVLSPNTPLDFDSSLAVVLGVANGLRGSGRGKTDLSPLRALFDSDAPSAQLNRTRFETLCQTAAKVVSSTQASPAARIAAARLLADSDYSVVGEKLLALLGPEQPGDLQTAVVRVLGQMTQPEVAPALLAPGRWQRYTPPLREAVLAALLPQPRHVAGMLTALENGAVPKAALTPAQRNQLLKHRDEAIRHRAEALFQNMAVGDRQRVYEEYKAVLKLEASSKNGQAVFKQHCSSCHRLDREGVAVGPDLFEIRSQPKEAILLHILIPEFEILPGYTGYVVETKDGRTLAGLIASETAASITLRRAQGEEETVLRSNLATITSTALSLMPQEMEKNMSKQDLADLIAYLKGE
jgi:putative membrane-bound dehydrogenase-like protein